LSNLSTKERNKLPDSAFCYVKGKTRLFPILDASDVESAKHLICKSPDPEGTKACIIGKAKSHGWAIPKEWQDDGKSKHAADSLVAVAPALFAAEPMVIKRGKVFEAGDYPDKGVDFTPEDLLRATVDFQPIPINSGHPLNASPLDGLMGELRSIELADDGVSLMGEAAIPQWLADLLPEGETKVSLEWAKAEKKPLACSLVLNPRIEDAALMAAFAKRHDTDQGQAVIQAIHDRAAMGGAVCKQDNAPARMASAHEAKAIQDIHDTATQHGAVCNAKGQGSLSMAPAYYSGDSPRDKGRSIMAGLGDILRWLKNAPEGVDAEAFLTSGTLQGQSGTTPAAATVPATFAAHDPEKDALRAELAREKAANIATKAANFAERIIETKQKAFPAEREALINAYTQAALDDTNYGVVTFGTGAQGTRVGLLEAAYEARPANQLTLEQLQPGIKGILFNNTESSQKDPNAPLSREELDKMLGMTALGQQILRERVNGAKA
jgi:hypothetical protein